MILAHSDAEVKLTNIEQNVEPVEPDVRTQMWQTSGTYDMSRSQGKNFLFKLIPISSEITRIFFNTR